MCTYGQYRSLIIKTLQPGYQTAVSASDSSGSLFAPAYHQGKNLCGYNGKVVELILYYDGTDIDPALVAELVSCKRGSRAYCESASQLYSCQNLSRLTFAVFSRGCDHAVIFRKRKKRLSQENPFHRFKIEKTCCLYWELASMTQIPFLLICQVIEMLLRPPRSEPPQPKKTFSSLFIDSVI